MGTNFFDAAFRTLSGMGPVAPPSGTKKVKKKDKWHRLDEFGNQVEGNHKASVVTDSPEVFIAKLADDKKLSQVAGKLNNMLRNVGSKTSKYDYKAESIKWANAFKTIGGQWTEQQDAAILAGLKKDAGNRDWFAAFKHNYNLPLVDNGVGHVAAPDNQLEEPIIVDDPAPGPSMVRPPDTPKRGNDGEKGGATAEKQRKLAADAAEARATSTEAVTQVQAPAPAQVPAPSTSQVVTPPATVKSTKADTKGNMAGGGGSVGVDPAGSLPFECIQSHAPQVRFDGNKQYFAFGGTRLMYSWAYEFFPGQVPAVNNIAANINDGVIVGHSIPWEWIPFYCTPAEYAMLPFGHGDIYVDKVRVRVTPMAKETQFTTNGATSGVASQEHLCLGKVAIGLNHKWPNTAQLRAKEGGTVSNAAMSYSAAGVTKIDFGDLSKRFWGNLSNWSSGVSPYANPTTTTPGVPRSTMEMNIREIETVQLMMWDQWDTTTQGNNTACWGVPLVDRFITRFPFMAAIGKPIVDEEYVPKNGCIYYVPHMAMLSKDDFGKAQFYGQKHCGTRLRNSYTANNRDDNNIDEAQGMFSKNSNIGTKQSILGSYHGTVEKQNFVHGIHGGYASNISSTTQPSICIGMEPIKPIDFTTSLGVPIQARAMWKIDYQIVFRVERPEHIFQWPYPTHIKPSAGVATPSALQKSGLPLARRVPIPEHAILPGGYDTTNLGQPKYEEPSVENVMCQNIFGRALQKYSDSNSTLADVAGASYSDPANLGTNGFRLTSD